jgi:MFS family permease
MSILYWMALGTFAIGTEGFMIAPLLPRLAEDLSVGVVAAGQLVTVFTISYALSSPILTALTGGISRRNLLIISMAGFAAANVVAAVATNYWMLWRWQPDCTFPTRTHWPERLWLPRSAAPRSPSSLAAPRSRSLSAFRSAP